MTTVIVLSINHVYRKKYEQNLLLQTSGYTVSVSHLDVFGPAVLLSLPFDPALDHLQCFLSGGSWAFDLRRRVAGALVQCGAEALGQGVASGTSLGAELALCTVFGV